MKHWPGEKAYELPEISETCAICKEECFGYDDGVSLQGWPDGVFIRPNGPWICQDCIPDDCKHPERLLQN